TGHTVTLSGVPTNCTVSGGISQTVTVPAGGTATAAFSVSCTATSGVEVSGTGQIGPGSPTAGSNLQTFTFDVTSGLSGTLAYTKSGTLTGGDIGKSTTGSPATGQLTVTTTTTGTSLPSGYTVTVDGTTSQPIGINSSATLTTPAPTSHTVALSSVPTNCWVS